jgi:exodeoxyribonuclease V gamma subunit
MPPRFFYLEGLRNIVSCTFFCSIRRKAFGDLETKRQRTSNEGFTGHPLLSTLGQQGREFQEMLLEQAQFDFEPESFELSEARNNLQQLQNDILNNRLDGQVLQKDDSISIHACHSRMREVEVL